MTRCPRLLLLTIAIFTTLALTLPLFIYLRRPTAFVCGWGSFHRDPSPWGRRRCLGVTHTPDSRDGYHTYCLGIPYGEWECFETYADEGPTRRISCH